MESVIEIPTKVVIHQEDLDELDEQGRAALTTVLNRVARWMDFKDDAEKLPVCNGSQEFKDMGEKCPRCNSGDLEINCQRAEPDNKEGKSSVDICCTNKVCPFEISYVRCTVCHHLVIEDVIDQCKFCDGRICDECGKRHLEECDTLPQCDECKKSVVRLRCSDCLHWLCDDCREHECEPIAQESDDDESTERPEEDQDEDSDVAVGTCDYCGDPMEEDHNGDFPEGCACGMAFCFIDCLEAHGETCKDYAKDEDGDDDEPSTCFLDAETESDGGASKGNKKRDSPVGDGADDSPKKKKKQHQDQQL